MGCKKFLIFVVLFLFGIILIGFVNAGTHYINNCADLESMSNDLSGIWILNQSINCNVPPYNTGSGFQSIGDATDSLGWSTPFSGTFNGNGHLITGFYQNNPTASGLFGYASGATIINVGLKNINIINTNNGDDGKGYPRYSYIGGLAGLLVSSIVNGCYSTGNISTSIGDVVGGLIADSSVSNISNSYSQVNILNIANSPYMVGGFVGVSSSYMSSLSSFSDCYSTGNVFGINNHGNPPPGGPYPGTYSNGFLGFDIGDISTYNGNYWDIWTSGKTTDWNPNNIGKTTTQMYQNTTYVGWSSSIWTLKNGDYPRLKWECDPVANCAGKTCGDDGCNDGGTCGTCASDTLVGSGFCKNGDNSNAYQNYTTYTCSVNTCVGSLITKSIACNPNQICSGGACIDYHQCSSPNDTILKLSYTYNGHGALWNDTNYLFDVCYSEIFGQAYTGTNTGTNPHSCNGNNKVIGLSATTNAVGEVPTNNNYLINVCYGNLTCRVSDKGDNSDSFDGASLDTSKWIQKNVNNPAVTENGRLKTFGSVGGIASSASGITSSGKWELHGDFDIQIGYDATLLPISNYFPTVALTVTGTHDYVLYVDRNASGSYKEHSWSEQSVWNNVGMAAATKGQFRIKRVGSNITGYIGDGNSWTMTTSASGLDTNDMYITIQTYNNVIEGTNTQGNVAQAYFDNFTISGGNCSANEKTVVALSAFTNAAIANRSDLNFPINICCKVSSTPGCIPDCSGGRVCGNDGCGGSSCGTCGSGYSCNSTGQCVPGCTSVCNLNDKECDVTTNISKTCIAHGSCNVWGSNTNCLYGCNTTSNDCLPTPQECQGISSCNDYQDPQNCSNDECLVGGGNCNSGQIENICGLTTSGSMTDCSCFWDDSANAGQKCQLNTNTNINIDTINIKQTCTISLQEKSQCIEGQNSVTQQATPNWENLDDLVGKQKPGQPPGTVFTDTNDAESWANTYCTLSNCFSGTKQMVCDDNGVRLSFFNWINFLAAIAVIVIVYLIWFLYTKKKGRKKVKK